VRRPVPIALVIGGCLAAGLLTAVRFSPGGAGRTIEIYLFVVASLAVAAMVLWIAKALPRAEPATWERPPRPQRLGQLESVQQMLDRAETSAVDLHSGLRPIAREIAAARLARRGVALDRQPARARELLGEQAWALVRADREAPSFGRLDRGCSRDELRAIVDALEAV
jgi:hypothetical protein